jgi:hypothetical protein
LTPYINSGDIPGGQDAALVRDPLVLDLGAGESQPESYSGFITVNEVTDNNM